MGTAASTERSPMKEVIPPWVYTVKIPPEHVGDKLGACSDGMSHVGPNTITRSRTGVLDTDGARWSRGFTSGKHTFEIVFPMGHRGHQATVGVSTEEAPLYAKGKVPLVGANKFSWGVCLRHRRAYHKNDIVKKYPVNQVYLPDKFYMYLDADTGSLQFGSDLDYYGTALSGIPRSQPLYPTVAACIQGATITVVYRGIGDASAIGPPPPCVVPAAPQMMSPQVAVRKEPPPPPPPTVVSNSHASTADPVEPLTAKVIEERLEEQQPQEKPSTTTIDNDKNKDKSKGNTDDKSEKKSEEKPAPAAAPKAETEAKPEAETEAKPDAEGEAKPDAEAEGEEKAEQPKADKAEEEKEEEEGKEEKAEGGDGGEAKPSEGTEA
ncbi:uncharacterized protein LOC143276372 [Babylonia areolata]|uniref:uncharacterized protein LOC143276372 n=1 Tax=Babylonia areolata TaxID=304850 RepID=UPI003FCF587B